MPSSARSGRRTAPASRPCSTARSAHAGAAAAGRQRPAGGRPGHRDRVGQGPVHRARRLRGGGRRRAARGARRPRPPSPTCTGSTRTRSATGAWSTSTTCCARAADALERRRVVRRGPALALPAPLRRRVPGRQPAAAPPAAGVARRAHRPVRRGRPQPGDLPVERRRCVVPGRVRRRVPRRRGAGPRPQPPLLPAGRDPGGRRARGGQGRRGDPAHRHRRPGPDPHHRLVRRRPGRGRGHRPGAPRAPPPGAPVVRPGRARAHQRADGRDRTGPAPGTHPVPRARRRLVHRPSGRARGVALGPRVPGFVGELPRRPRRRRGHGTRRRGDRPAQRRRPRRRPHARSGAHRAPRVAAGARPARPRHAHRRARGPGVAVPRLVGRHGERWRDRAALARCGRRGQLPRQQGARVARGAPRRARGGLRAEQPRPHRGRPRRGAAPALRGPDPRRADLEPLLGAATHLRHAHGRAIALTVVGVAAQGV